MRMGSVLGFGVCVVLGSVMMRQQQDSTIETLLQWSEGEGSSGGRLAVRQVWQHLLGLIDKCWT